MSDQPLTTPNPNADRDAQLADGVLDRTEGEDYNPNPADVVAEQRAKFDADSNRLLADHHKLESEMAPLQQHLADEARAAAEDPAHQAVLEHQREHQEHDPKLIHAGQEIGSVMAPELRDDGLLPDQGASRPLGDDPNSPIIPIRGPGSMRKDQ